MALFTSSLIFTGVKMSYDKKCAGHCWTWARKDLDWLTDEGTYFKGGYVVWRCGHCMKMGKILFEYDAVEHEKLIQGSQQGFARVHGRGPCPAKKNDEESKPKKKEYSYDF